MRIGVLEAGAPPAALVGRFGRYPEMFRALLGDGYAWTTYRTLDGALPGRPEDHDAYIVTGSPAGVYDDEPWIGPLLDFLRAAKGKAKLVGVCFGHQAMAQAFGGQVAKSAKGWGVGLHAYEVREAAPWMTPAAASVAVAASHQDQVARPPPGARVLASSDFTPFGMLAYADQPAISIQLHPEFAPDFARALIESRRGARLDAVLADAAVDSLREPNDRELVGAWIKRFLEG